MDLAHGGLCYACVTSLFQQGCKAGIFNANFHKFGLFKRGLTRENADSHVRQFCTFLLVLAEKSCLAFFKLGPHMFSKNAFHFFSIPLQY